MLHLLSEAYDYPVDVEFTVNYRNEKEFFFNLVQCRPLQTRGLGKTVEIPKLETTEDCLFYSEGNFMGGNLRVPIDKVVLWIFIIILPARNRINIRWQDISES